MGGIISAEPDALQQRVPDDQQRQSLRQTLRAGPRSRRRSRPSTKHPFCGPQIVGQLCLPRDHQRRHHQR